MRAKRITIANKVLILSSTIIILLNLMIAAMLSKISFQDELSHFEANGVEVLKIIAAGLDEAELQDIYTNMDEDSDSYRGMHSYLMKMKMASTLKYLYTLVYTEEGKKAYYLVDGQGKEADEFCELGAIDTWSEATADFEKLLAGEASSSKIYKTAEWGSLMTVEIPIYNKDNEEVIVLAGDFDAATILEDSYHFKIQMNISLFIAAIIQLIGIYWCINKMIKKNFKILNHMMEETARFDFTNMELGVNLISQKDEMGDIALGTCRMRKKLKEKAEITEYKTSQIFNDVDNIHHKLEKATAASQQISDSINDLVRGISEQALSTSKGYDRLRALEENIEHLNAEIKMIANLAKHSQEVSMLSRNAIEALQETTQNSQGISEQVNKRMIQLMESSNSIESIMKVINTVAEQTNLLALNAAIEAAKAGEVGKGFAVVSNEIKKLSTDTACSTQEVRKILEQIVREVNEASQAINNLNHNNYLVGEISSQVIADSEEMQKEVMQIVRGSEKLEEVMLRAAKHKEDMRKITQDIATQAQEYNTLTEEIAACVEDEVRVTEEILKIADGLKESAEELKQTIQEYKL